MLKFLVYIGRCLFVATLIAQAGALSMYPIIYYDNKDFTSLFISLSAPTFIAFGFITFFYGKAEDELVKKLWIVWALYVFIFLIPTAGLIFVGLREKLDKNQFFGPNILKITMCGSPVVALLLVTTALSTDSTLNYNTLMSKLFWHVAMDLFDDIEILAMILPHSGSITIPLGLDVLIIACVFVSLALSVVEMGENKVVNEGEYKPREHLYFYRLILQMLFVNFPLLVIRLVVWLNYKHEASIFTAKNAMAIFYYLLEILKLRRCCGCDVETDAVQYHRNLAGVNNRPYVFMELEFENYNV